MISFIVGILICITAIYLISDQLTIHIKKHNAILLKDSLQVLLDAVTRMLSDLKSVYGNNNENQPNLT